MTLKNEVSYEIFNFILDNVKLLIGLDELSDKATEEDKKQHKNTIDKLTFYINYLCKQILIKTNRYNFPEDLKYLVINLTCDTYDLHMKPSEENTEVQSVSETGRSVTFGTNDSYKTKFQMLIAKQIEDNEKQINRYRLLYKTRCSKDEKN